MLKHALELLKNHRTLAWLCLTTFFVVIGQGIINPVLPLYVNSFGISVTLVGVVIGVFGFGRLVVNIPIGYVAERYGRRIFLVGGPIVSAISAVLMAIASTYGELVVYRLISGIGSVIYITDITTPRNRARYLSLQEGSLVFSASVGPILGGLTAELWGLRAPFLLFAGFCVIGTFLAWTQLHETKSLPGVTPATARSSSPTGKKGILQALLDPSFFLVGLFGMMIFFTRTGGRGSIMPLLGVAKAGLSVTELGIVFTINALVAFIVMIPAGILSDRFGRKVVILPAALVTALGLALFSQAESMGIYVVAGIILGMGIGIAGANPSRLGG